MDHKREYQTPPLVRVMGVGRQQQQVRVPPDSSMAERLLCCRADPALLDLASEVIKGGGQSE